MRTKLILVLAMLLGLGLAVQGQTSRGTVSGTVTDSSGAVVAGATVTLSSRETTLTRTATTNDSGFYRFDAVDLGNYSVTIESKGFGTLTKTNVVVSANQTSGVDAQLNPGEQKVTVDVVSESFRHVSITKSAKTINSRYAFSERRNSSHWVAQPTSQAASTLTSPLSFTTS